MILKTFRAVPGLFLAAFLGCVNTQASAADANDALPGNATLVYVGTFTDTPAHSKGIYYFRLQTNEVSGSEALVPLGLAAEISSPTFLALDSKRHLLFCANEVDSFGGKRGGAVSSFAIDPATGKLNLINQSSSMGTRPCHVALDKTGRNLLVANYNSGNVAVLPVAADGRIGEASCVIQDAGKGPNPSRQEGPHAHCVTLSPDNRFVYVCDLGIDKVMIFKFDAERGQLTPNEPAFVQTKPGAGPRHLVFHPNGKFAYLIHEMASTITTFAYDEKTGALTELQTLSSLPNGYNGPNTGAEIAVVPSGKFLFASNRGENAIVSFAIDPAKGTLTYVGKQSSGGKVPRFFGISPSGNDLVICNQGSDSALVCRLNATGEIKPGSALTPIASPVCAVFLSPASGGR